MVLIEVGNSGGTYGRCDAKCYNAKTAECTCVCGGKNHGKGRAAALAGMTETLIKQLEWSGAKIPDTVKTQARQIMLFNEQPATKKGGRKHDNT